ncbi:alpha-glucuronidase family glycosyl hydrolase [Saccharicrinis fermentans]|uniref:Xylan alpha-1,2-glucuronidase n=1 Tax=Saccharicrinis fermentans DSM 9555 = JCM 21142 TaxID=869213 RepID=W7YB33_9BACT|nr:alpha-glucuronidase family glycosyl hydrolase [Saccharicrinis fermentans]GAF04873.1 alpha-glucuronidase [Saccharicrinis fermentans DSM 9555 = JCM 21142]
MKITSLIFIYLLFIPLIAESQYDGRELWFAQNKILKANVHLKPNFVNAIGEGTTFDLAKKELVSGLEGLFDCTINYQNEVQPGNIVIALKNSGFVDAAISNTEMTSLGEEGFIIKYIASKKLILLTGNTEVSVLYAVYHYLRLLQTSKINLSSLNIIEVPSYQKRVLNHWDNLDGSVERGYAGRSIWKWDDLPNVLSKRYISYAKANASIGINGTVLNNVNASPDILLPEYLLKVKAIASVLRPFGIQVYLSVNFSSPAILDGLATANPKDKHVVLWWKNKVEEIYQLIPDFGGFLVKANSEGQPGPMDFGCTHAEGANMLADILAPYEGVVMWRAFVYNANGNDRAKQAYEEFMPLDNKFRKNVLVQVKNGPIDFQPREPFSPLFGAMKGTSLMPELQITQEYLGFSSHLVYLGTLYKEFLWSDTYSNGRGSTVAQVSSNKNSKRISGIAGVANIGSDNNWCGHHFAQSNWYVFGRLAWNPSLNVRHIAKEWIRLTLTQDEHAVKEIASMMMKSREAVVNYMTPLGLHHLMGWDHHYGPEPWCVIPNARADWLPSYYHKADSLGIGFNRSSSGTNATEQYAEPLRELFDNEASCPLEYLLWFHHLSWNYELKNGNSLWEELCYHYQDGVNQVRSFRKIWKSLEANIATQQFIEVNEKLKIQEKEAIWWRDACLLYFQSFSKQALPYGVDNPIYKLEELKKQKFDLQHHN